MWCRGTQPWNTLTAPVKNCEGPIKGPQRAVENMPELLSWDEQRVAAHLNIERHSDKDGLYLILLILGLLEAPFA